MKAYLLEKPQTWFISVILALSDMAHIYSKGSRSIQRRMLCPLSRQSSLTLQNPYLYQLTSTSLKSTRKAIESLHHHDSIYSRWERVSRLSIRDVIAFDAKIPELGPKDVVVRITHTGLCASDVAMVKLGAPVALGHEGVGIVELVGFDVKQLKVGDRVGGGYHRYACGSCKFCLRGKDIYCYDRIVMGEGDYDNGTFGQFYIGKETFLRKIPDNIPSEDAAPLQCAGVTVYTALRETVEPGMRVGIYGIGGLDHLAIQFAAKMGTEVVVYSTSADKEQEARAWGASEFHLVSTMYETIKAPIDVLVITGSYYPHFERLVNYFFVMPYTSQFALSLQDVRR